MSMIDDLLQQNKKLHFSLIDPDKQAPKDAGEIAKICENYGTNAIMLGGTTVRSRKLVYDTVAAIKGNVDLPTILFPNSALAISENADYILFMVLLNSLESKYRVEEQAKGAPLIKKWGIKSISTGYVVVSTSKNPTTIERRVKLDKIDIDDIEKAVDHAVYAEKEGMSCVYFDAGSGAEKPISNEMVQAIREHIEIPIIIGGGIRDGDTAKEKIDAGADVIVNGTIIEDERELIRGIIEKIRNY